MGLVNTTPINANSMDQEYIANYQYSQYGEGDIDADDLAECLQDADVDMAIEADMADAKKKKEEEENARIEEDKIK